MVNSLQNNPSEAVNFRHSFNEIISINEQILASMRVQKAYVLTVLNRWETAVRQELDIPNNKYLHWYNIVTPFMDSFIHTKLVDQEIEKKLMAYVDALKGYESGYVIDYNIIEQLELTVDKMVEIIQKLESQIISMRTEKNNTIDEPPYSKSEEVESTPEFIDTGSQEGSTPKLFDNDNQYQQQEEIIEQCVDEESDESDEQKTQLLDSGSVLPPPVNLNNKENKTFVVDKTKQRDFKKEDVERLKNIQKAKNLLQKLSQKYN